MVDSREIGKRIEQRRKELNLTLDDIATQISVARSTVQRYEKGTIGKIKIPVIDAIAKVLKVDPAWIACKTDEMHPVPQIGTPYTPTHRIPILGYISAGLPLYAEEHVEGYTYTTLNSGAEYFALRVKGDSMTAARIMDGDILIVRRQDTVNNGEIAVVLVGDDNATVKRFYQAGRVVTLAPQSNNPDHAPQIYDLSTTTIRVLGKVVQSQISF